MNKRLYRFFTPSGDFIDGTSIGICLANLAEVARKLGMRNACTLTRDLPDETWVYTTRDFSAYRTIARGSVAWATKMQLEQLRDVVRGRHIRILQRIIDRMPEDKAPAKPEDTRPAEDLNGLRRVVANRIALNMVNTDQANLRDWQICNDTWSTRAQYRYPPDRIARTAIIVMRFTPGTDAVELGNARFLLPEDEPEMISDPLLREALIREQAFLKMEDPDKVLEISRVVAFTYVLLDRMGHLGELKNIEAQPVHVIGDWFSTVVQARREGVCDTYLVLILFAPGKDTVDPNTTFGGVAHLPVGHEKIEPYMVEMARQRLSAVQDTDQNLKQTLLEALYRLEHDTQAIAAAKPAPESAELVLVAQQTALACQQVVPGCEEPVIPNKEVAAAFGVDPSTLRSHKARYPILLQKNVHYVLLPTSVAVSNAGHVQDSLCWTREGIEILVTYLVGSPRAKAFLALLLQSRKPTTPSKAQPPAVDPAAVAESVRQALLPELKAAQAQTNAELTILKREAAAAKEQLKPLQALADQAWEGYLHDQGIATVRTVNYSEPYTGDPVPEAYHNWWSTRRITNAFRLPPVMAEYGHHGRPDSEFLYYWLAAHGLLDRKAPITPEAAAAIGKTWVWWPTDTLEQHQAATTGGFYWHRWNWVIKRISSPFPGQAGEVKRGQIWRFSEAAVNYLYRLWSADANTGCLVQLAAEVRPSWFRTAKGKEYLANYGVEQSGAADQEAVSLAADDPEQA